MLKEFLRKFLGKTIVVRFVRGGQMDGIAGELREENGDLFFYRERKVVTGQPQMTQMGVVTPQQVFPETNIYFGDMPLSDMVAVEVPTETGEEAKAKLEAEGNSLGKKPLIEVPKMMPAPPRSAR